jgi:hypothetical protein
MIDKKITVEMRAYSISRVALKAINMREKNLKVLLLKAVLRFFGILIALPENKPWYKIMRVKRMGCVLMMASVGLLIGPRKFENFFIYSNLRYFMTVKK